MWLAHADTWFSVTSRPFDPRLILFVLAWNCICELRPGALVAPIFIYLIYFYFSPSLLIITGDTAIIGAAIAVGVMCVLILILIVLVWKTRRYVSSQRSKVINLESKVINQTKIKLFTCAVNHEYSISWNIISTYGW